MGIIKTRGLTPEEEFSIYGERVVEVGKAFRVDNHYFLQREDDVLHVNTGEGNWLINGLNVGHLNQTDGAIEIKRDEFDMSLKQTIYELHIGKYWCDL